MAKDTTKKMISLEISQELYQALRKEAFERELTVSALIRNIVEEKLMKDSKGE